jgi:hypothetical protein
MQEKRKKIVTLRQNILRRVLNLQYYENIFNTMYSNVVFDGWCARNNRSDNIPAVWSYGG